MRQVKGFSMISLLKYSSLLGILLLSRHFAVVNHVFTLPTGTPVTSAIHLHLFLRLISFSCITVLIFWIRRTLSHCLWRRINLNISFSKFSIRCTLSFSKAKGLNRQRNTMFQSVNLVLPKKLQYSVITPFRQYETNIKTISLTSYAIWDILIYNRPVLYRLLHFVAKNNRTKSSATP